MVRPIRWPYHVVNDLLEYPQVRDPTFTVVRLLGFHRLRQQALREEIAGARCRCCGQLLFDLTAPHRDVQFGCPLLLVADYGIIRADHRFQLNGQAAHVVDKPSEWEVFEQLKRQAAVSCSQNHR